MKNTLNLIKYRISSLKELEDHPPTQGALIDLRTHNHQVILSSDLFSPGDCFFQFLERWREKNIEGPLIIQLKEWDLESVLFEYFQEKEFDNYIFINLPMTTLSSLLHDHHEHLENVSLRISEYEPLENTYFFEEKVKWVWLDSLTGRPFPLEMIKKLSTTYNLLLVSPEIRGYSQKEIFPFKELTPYLKGVCTKYPNLWKTP